MPKNVFKNFDDEVIRNIKKFLNTKNNEKMSIKIRKKPLSNGEFSLYLDKIYEGERDYEFMNLRILPGKKYDEQNKETMMIAEKIRSQRWNEIINGINGFENIRKGKVNFFEFAEEAIQSYSVAKRGYQGVVKMLKSFHGKDVLYPVSINEKFLGAFYTYMESKLTGETPSTYFKKLKRLLKEATKEKLFKENPSLGFRCRKFESKIKPVLSFEEIQLLVESHCANQDVKDAFIFCCLTGVRFGDVKALKAAHINGNRFELVQKKTKVKIYGILNEDAQKIVKNRIKKEGLIFTLPSHTSCLKNLRKWLKNAGIDKHIGWHNSRHSFGTNLILHDTDIFTASKLLGHKSIIHTQRYVRESIKMKEEAVNKLPKLLYKN